MNRGQISLEFAIFFALIVATAAIAGFYYLKMTSFGSASAKNTVGSTESKMATETVRRVENVREAIGR
ncbi:Protein of unknown function DUF361 [Methanocaldococcus infernus ME]|uniref:Class III signal peptide-containing protein n=1 Tax=Methanocaldococcus infernus (strain DSM 11812 / JCM 15783 / ME) TaxID=573063 RepID=D5VRK6_METIM|nr:class III signal peptide domain-containing protein, archaeosortase D/PIP-CTERM system-associated [Methanocaldococcus infernus]ADG13209.1 Protein of unknown function DUF361 [Methanocaldococcus infernus ME]